MEEDDRDELLQCTDDESLSENEDQCLPADNRRDATYLPQFSNHSKVDFLITKISLIASTTLMLILLPGYIDSINVKGNVYSMILTNTALAAALLLVSLAGAKYFLKNYRNVSIFELPMRRLGLLVVVLSYIGSGALILYSLDRKRVLCHLQDPIKAVVLVFSLLSYFLFCRKLMGLKRIFSATTIIVGLFIAVDYGLCDEFKCRGFERLHIADDTGHWPGKIHSIWTSIYIIGLALFSAYFIFLDRFLLHNDNVESESSDTGNGSVSTVSRAVSANTELLGEPVIRRRSLDKSCPAKKNVYLHLAFWFHLLALVVILVMFWVDLLPGIGKTTNVSKFFNYTSAGIVCHFGSFEMGKNGGIGCGNVAAFSWPFLLCYVIFFTTSLKFFMLSQSAVYTVATLTTSLPLVEMWWSVFQLAPVRGGASIIWSPSITGELICALLGLPVILIGLVLLYKAHSRDIEWSNAVAANQITTASQFA